MKMNRAEIAIIAVTAVFLFSIGGYAFGRNSRNLEVAMPQSETVANEEKEADPAGEKLDLNTATVDDLVKLPNIGDKRAKAIIAYREEIGGFRSVFQLESVPGIGPTLLEDLMQHLCVS